MRAVRLAWGLAAFVLFGSAVGALGCASGEAKPGAMTTPDAATGAAGAAGGAGSGDTDAAGSGAAGAAGGGAAGAAGTVDGALETPDADAGAVADAPAETPPDAAAPCTTSGTELCEDFESGAIDPKIWGTHVTAGGALVVDKQHVHGGAYALHVKLTAGAQQTAQITDAVTFPAHDNTFYTRAYVYVSPDLPADMMGGYHMAYLLATGNNDLGFVEAGLGSAGNKQYVGYSEYYGDGADVHAHGPTFTEFGPDSSTMVVPKTWLCLELMQGGDATTTHRRVWVDGKELPEQVSDFSDRKPPTFSLMSIGILQYHQTPILTDVWIDDIRVSSARIGCDGIPL
jgi:hypothetical protein